MDKITRFHNVLALAQRISRHRRVIFEIDLDFPQGIAGLQRFWLAATIHQDPIVAPENLPDRFGGAG
jgi:hypothetical protein